VTSASLTAPGAGPLRRWALLVATALVAALGPALVVEQRWIRWREPYNEYLTGWADRFPFLADINLPDYAAVFAVAFLILLVLSRLQTTAGLGGWRNRIAFARRARRPTAPRRQRLLATAVALAGAAGAALLFVRLARRGVIPGPSLLLALAALGFGMVLREISLEALLRLWRRKRAVVLSIVAAHVAVILAFASVHTYHRFELPLIALALAATINLAARWRKTGPVPLLVLAAVVVYLWRVDAWWFALVGDEYRNYDIAQGILKQHDRAFVLSHLFQLEGGLEGLDPYACSLVQAASMRLLGVNSFGWRFSSLYCAALALPFFYRFLRTFLSRNAALATTVIMAASHYIIAFGKIGYDKFQAYLAMGMLLAATACAVRTRRMVAFVGLGFSAALCFYVYPAALYILPLPAFLLLFFVPPKSREALARWVMAGAVALLTIFPLPFQPTYFEGKRPGTVYYNPELIASKERLIRHFWSNGVYAVYSPVLLGSEDHFVTSSYVDPLTGALFLVGIATGLWLLRRDRFVTFLVLSLGFLLLLGGTTHDREYPPTTRFFLLVPLFCMMATVGLWRLLGLGGDASLSSRTARAVVAAVLVAVVGLNVVQAHVVSVRRSDNYQLLDPLVVRLATRIETLPAGQRPGLVMLSQAPTDGDGIVFMLHAYDLHESAARYRTIGLGEDGSAPLDPAVAADRTAAIFVSPLVPAAARERLDRELQAAGRVPCSVRTTTGHERFRLWETPGTPPLCGD
jgi:hypothetical protein